MSDPLHVLGELKPSADPTPDVLDRVRSDLMAHMLDHPTLQPAQHPTPKSRRAVKRWIGGIAAVVVLATTGTAWAISRRSSESSTSIMCPGTAVIDAASGDPVTDCVAEWQRVNGTPPPPMVAYDNGRGGIEVHLGSEDVPDSYVVLQVGQAQDTRLIELDDVINDAGGLAAGCADETAARALGEREMARLGITGWTITTDEDRRPDGSTLCAMMVVRGDLDELQVVGVPPRANPFSPFAVALATELSSTCTTLSDAADLVRAVAARADVIVDGNKIEFTEANGGLVIHEVEDAEADCTRSTVNVGGRVEVTLRGPN